MRCCMLLLVVIGEFLSYLPKSDLVGTVVFDTKRATKLRLHIVCERLKSRLLHGVSPIYHPIYHSIGGKKNRTRTKVTTNFEVLPSLTNMEGKHNCLTSHLYR
jgi:hypothetical protein